MVSRLLSVWIVLFMLSLSPLLKAASLSAAVDRDRLTLGETLALELTAIGTQKPPNIVPLMRDFEVLQRPGRTVIKSTGKRKIWRLLLTPKKAGVLQLPALSVGETKSQPLLITVLSPKKQGVTTNAAASAAKPSADYQMQLSAETLTPWVQSQVRVTLKVLQRRNISWNTFQAPSSSDWLIRPLGKEKNTTERINGQWFFVSELQFVAFAQKSGAVRLPPASITAQVPAKNGRGKQTVRLRSNALNFQVRAQPERFPKGQWWLAADSVQLSEQWQTSGVLEPGEPVARQIRLTVQGAVSAQLPALAPPTLAGAQIYAEPALDSERVAASGLISQRLATWTVIPDGSTHLQLPPVEVYWWRTKTRTLEVARLPGRALRLSALRQATGAVPMGSDATFKESTVEDGERSSSRGLQRLGGGGAWMLWCLGAGVLVLLLLTLKRWWTKPKTDRSVKKKALSGQMVPTEAMAPVGAKFKARQLAKACRRGDVRRVLEQLLAWGRSHWPESPPANLLSLAGRTHDRAFQRICRGLDRALYGQEVGNLNTSEVLSHFRRMVSVIQQEKRAQKLRDKQDDLPHL